jgi:outer membrane receptor protein involved in Fe transport
VQADRRLRRVGVLASATHSRGRHVLKVGAEAARLSLHEDFLFAVTDPDEDKADFTPVVKGFTIGRPFVFSGTGTPSLVSAYLQDSIRLADRLTVDVGVRADWSRMLALASQVSPRLGVAYRVARTATLVRASFGRFFQPPQAENLLLASSVQARVLSPFASDSGSGSGSGGADLVPERQSAVETGVDQTLGPVRLDVAWWRRWVRNAADPNVFLGTTIIFPNAVARGWASGIDVRLDVAPQHGWSGFVSYSNSRVEQAGPITGGLFLEDDIADLAEGERFTPDHDQRNVAAAGLSFVRDGFSAAANARFESGTPLQLGDEDLDEVKERPGAALVDFERGRVKPRRTLDLTFSQRVHRTAGAELSLRLSLLNVTNARWAYNFGNPFSGTHFGPARTVQVGLRASF